MAPNKYSQAAYVCLYIFIKMPPHQKAAATRKSNKTEMECECVYLDCYYLAAYTPRLLYIHTLPWSSVNSFEK